MTSLAVGDLFSLQPLPIPGISSSPLVTGLVPQHAAPILSCLGAAWSHLTGVNWGVLGRGARVTRLQGF